MMRWDNCFSENRTRSNKSTQIPRTEYQRDFDRLIFASSFRRLQNKTQVFPLPGSSGGGCGAGILGFLDGAIISGIQFFMNYVNFEQELEQADLVITGEGKLDHQSLDGKVVSGVLEMAQRKSIPAAIICGISDLTLDDLAHYGVIHLDALVSEEVSVDNAMKNASNLVVNAGQRLTRIISDHFKD